MKDPLGEALSALRRVCAGDPEWPGAAPDCVRLPARWWTDGGTVLGAAWNASFVFELESQWRLPYTSNVQRKPAELPAVRSLRLSRTRVAQLHATLQRFLPEVEAAVAECRLAGVGTGVGGRGQFGSVRWCHEFFSLVALTAIAAADPLRTLYLVYERGVDVLLIGTVEEAP